jgi:hypothetical protein
VLGLDVLEREPHVRGNVLGGLDLQRTVADESDRDLLVELALVRLEFRQQFVAVVLRLDRPDVGVDALEIDLHRGLVGDIRVEAVLRAWVSPAGVDPDLRFVQALDRVVEEIDEEVQGSLVRAPGG